jgi:hypothetical protein
MGSISSNAATARASTALKKKKNRNISDKRKPKRKNTRDEKPNLVGLDREENHTKENQSKVHLRVE